MIFRPKVVREVALGLPDYAAVVINAVTGLLVVAAISLQWLPLFTGTLVGALTILFGPLAGFTVSSLYSRVEWTVGRRLGGKASHDELYLLFAWSSLPVGSAVLLYALILLMPNKPSIVTELVVSIPSLAIFLLAMRNYGASVIASQQFTRTRGVISIVVTLVFFLILVAGGGTCFSLIFKFGPGESLWSLLVQP